MSYVLEMKLEVLNVSYKKKLRRVLCFENDPKPTQSSYLKMKINLGVREV